MTRSGAEEWKGAEAEAAGRKASGRAMARRRAANMMIDWTRSRVYLYTWFWVRAVEARVGVYGRVVGSKVSVT